MHNCSGFHGQIMRATKVLLLQILLLLCLPISSYSMEYITSGEKISVSLFLKGKSPDNDFESVIIPLKRTGRLFLIEALIDGEEGNLIFDTGATGLVLNKTYFRNHTTSSKGTAGGVTGSGNQISSTVAARMELSGIRYDKTDADMANLGHIEDRRGVKILGLFGMDLLTSMEVIFDARQNELRLSKLDDKGNPLGQTGRDVKFDFTEKLEMPGNLMLIKATIGARELSFCLDTGAEINVVHYSLPKKVLLTIDINKRSNIGGSGSGSTNALYGVMNDLQFGQHQFGTMDAAIINLTSMSEAYGCNIDGMLGYDFWQKGVFCFNFKKRQISFKAVKGEKE